MTAPLTADQANTVYDVLVEHAGASEEGRDDFVYTQTEGIVHEYRFGGSLGFGGKFWRTTGRRRTDPDLRWYVYCYAEDSTPARQAAVEATNTALDALRQSVRS